LLSLKPRKERKVMSHFYGSMRGNRGKATRGGTKKSGFEAHIRGWNIGIRAHCFYNTEKDKDSILVYKTGGSNRSCADELITKIEE